MRAAVLVLLLSIVTAIALPAAAQGPMISTGAVHSCGLDSVGSVFCWGDNSGGQLGDGVITAELKFDVAGLASGVAAIAAGTNHVCAATTAGAALCWGNNDAGQLGDGTITSRSTPAPVSGLSGVRAFALGQGFSCARNVGGVVRCWGLNSSGQLGDGTTLKRTMPVDVVGLGGGVRDIAAGDTHACALTSAGGVKCWGRNDRGQLGDGTTTQRMVPTDVQGLAGDIVAIGAGATHTCAIDTAGAVRCWGANDGAQLGDGTTAQRNAPVDVMGLGGGIRKVAMAYRKTCALSATGGVKCWGAGGDATHFFPPTDVPGLTSDVADIASGQYHFCAITLAGGMKCWQGPNRDGELGDGTINGSITPVDVIGIPAGIQAMALGSAFTCALLPTNGVRCWGENFYGQLGASSSKGYNVAGRVPGLVNVAGISAGRDHTCALVGGGAMCWGSNGRGQLGDGTTLNRGTPGDVQGLRSGVRAVHAGNYYSCAVTAAGGAKCWGTNQLTPLDIAGLASGVASIALGGSHVCVLLISGGVRCWGANGSGQLGDGSTTIRSTPVDVVGLASGISAISAGLNHTCALTTAGALKCWGGNSFGQLGDGTTTARATPIDVAAAIGPFKAAVAGYTETCAVTRNGATWCWGYAAERYLAAPRSQPVMVASLATGVTTIDGGEAHLCALLEGGGVNCFGTNTEGQLGDGSKVRVRRAAQSVVTAGGRLFLDLTPENPLGVEKLPPFAVVASGTGVNVHVNIQFRPQDTNTSGSVYVFALVPPSLLNPPGAAENLVTPKDAPLPCVLAQLTSAGELQQVTSSSLQAYLTGVLSAQGQAVTVMNGVSASQLGGATFYVGYGTSSSAMFASGTNRSVATVGAGACEPQAPQTGWWWNPAEGGRGYSLEVQGNHIFFAAFHYDVSGRATWNVATGATSLDGSQFTGDLLSVAGGQTLGGPYPGFPRVSTLGPLTLVFNDASHGTMSWPGGTVPIERFNIVANGLNSTPLANQPETGWWWNPQESGRGFFIEWQNGVADLAGYMYDDAGNPVWYIAVYDTPNPRQFSGNWWQYANGQSMMAPWRPATRISDNVAPVTIQFSGPDTAIMTLPNGRTTALTRQRF